MYIAEFGKRELKILEEFNGEKSVNEIMEFFAIENKSSENVRSYLKRNKIPYKRERKFYNSRKRELSEEHLKQEKGLELTVGKTYKVRDDSYKKEDEMYYEGKIIREYPRYYLGLTKTGYKFTLSKFPNCYKVRELKG